jgi:hypothetical protein
MMEDTLNTVTILENELATLQQEISTDQQTHAELLQNKAKGICEYLKSKDRKRGLQDQLKYTKEISRMIELEEVMYTSTTNNWELKQQVTEELNKITEFCTYKRKFFEDKERRLQEELVHYTSLLQSKQQTIQDQRRSLQFSVRELSQKLGSLHESKVKLSIEKSDILQPKVQHLESRLKSLNEDIEELKKQRSAHIFVLQKKLMEEQQESLTINQEIETVMKQLS